METKVTTAATTTAPFSIDMSNEKLPPEIKAVSQWTMRRQIYKCPVCGGRGFVQNGFYSSTGDTWVTSTTAPEQCRSCCGKGYIIE